MTIKVEVVFSPGPRRVEMVLVALPEGSTLADAVAASGLAARHDLQSIAMGRRGQLAAPDTSLRDGDHVELYRALAVDPNEARRLRHAGQRAAVAKQVPKKKRPAVAGR